MFVVDHSEAALGVVVEHHTADYLVGTLDDADAQVALLEQTQQVWVVVQLVQALPHLLRLTLNQRLKSLDVVQFRLTHKLITFRIIMLSSSSKLKSLVNC